MNAIRLLCAAALANLALTAATALAQPAPAPSEAPPVAEEKPTPYDPRLARLSEVVGAIHYLRNLCGQTPEPQWRAAMEDLLETETSDEPARRERMTAAFNRGYRSFASVYTSCTPLAVAAEERYRNEGATLVGEITARFGN